MTAMNTMAELLRGFLAAFIHNWPALLFVAVAAMMVARQVERARVARLLVQAEKANATLLRELQQIQSERNQLLGRLKEKDTVEVADMDDSRAKVPESSTSMVEGISSFTVVNSAEIVTLETSPLPPVIETAQLTPLEVSSQVHEEPHKQQHTSFVEDPSLSTAMETLVEGFGSIGEVERALPTLVEVLVAKRKHELEASLKKALEDNEFEELKAVCSIKDDIIGDLPDFARARDRLKAMSIERDLKLAIENEDEKQLLLSLNEADMFNSTTPFEQVPIETIHAAGMALLRVSSRLDSILQSVGNDETSSLAAAACERLPEALSEEMWIWQPSAPPPSSPSTFSLENEGDDDDEDFSLEMSPPSTAIRPIEQGMKLLARFQTQKELQQAMEARDVEATRHALTNARLRSVADSLRQVPKASEWVRLRDCSSKLNKATSQEEDSLVTIDQLQSAIDAGEAAIREHQYDDPRDDEKEEQISHLEDDDLATMCRMEKNLIRPLVHTAKQRLYFLRMKAQLDDCIAGMKGKTLEEIRSVLMEYQRLCSEGWLSTFNNHRYDQALDLLKRLAAVKVLKDSLLSSRKNISQGETEKKTEVSNDDVMREEKDPYPCTLSIVKEGQGELKELLTRTASALEFAEQVYPDVMDDDSPSLYASVQDYHAILLEAYLTEHHGLNGTRCLATLTDIGMDRVDDFRLICEGDLRQCGIPRLLTRKIAPVLVELGRSADETIRDTVGRLRDELLV